MARLSGGVWAQDPLLTSRLVAAEVRGIQSQHVIATVKHYIANNQASNGDALLDERTLHEIYTPPFAAAVAAGAGAAMSASPVRHLSAALTSRRLTPNVRHSGVPPTQSVAPGRASTAAP